MAVYFFSWVCPFSKTFQVYNPGHSNTLSGTSLSMYVNSHCFSVCGVASLDEIPVYLIGFIMNNKDTPLSTIQEIMRVLEALCQNRTKTKPVFLLISQYFTCIISLNLHNKPMREVVLWSIPIFRRGFAYRARVPVFSSSHPPCMRAWARLC